jgi:hypothetical protein
MSDINKIAITLVISVLFGMVCMVLGYWLASIL